MKFNSYISPLTRSTGKSISKFQNSGTAKDTANPSTTKQNKVVEWDKNGTAKGEYVLTNEAPKGSKIKLKDPVTGQIIEATVSGPIPEGIYDKNTKVILSPDLGRALKLDTRGANGTATTRVNLEAEYTPISASSQPAAANDNQQQPLAQNAQQNIQGTVIPPANTGAAAPNQVGTQVAPPPVSSTVNTPPATPPAVSPATPPAVSPATPTEPQYVDIIPEKGDTSYEYRYDKTNKRWETRKKGGEWVILDDSTERKKAAREAIQARYGSQAGKFLDALGGLGKKDAGTEAGTGAAAGTGTGAATGTDAGTSVVGTTTASNQNISQRYIPSIRSSLQMEIDRFLEDRQSAQNVDSQNSKANIGTTTSSQGPVNGTVSPPQGTGTSTGTTSVGQGPVNGNVTPSQSISTPAIPAPITPEEQRQINAKSTQAVEDISRIAQTVPPVSHRIQGSPISSGIFQKEVTEEAKRKMDLLQKDREKLEKVLGKQRVQEMEDKIKAEMNTPTTVPSYYMQGGPIRVDNIDQAKVGKFLKGVGNVLSDYGRGIADGFGNWTGTFDLDNSKYKTNVGRSFSNVTDALTSTTGKIGRTIANKFVPGLGTAAGAIGGISSGAAPQGLYNQQMMATQQPAALSNMQLLNQMLGYQGPGSLSSILMAPSLGNYQEGAQVTPTIYINETAPEKFSTGLNDQLYSNPYAGKSKIDMERLPASSNSSSSSFSEGERTIIIPDQKTGKNYEAVIDREGNIKKIREVKSNTSMSSKQEYDMTWDEIMNATNPPQKQQGGVPLVGLPSRRFFQNSMQKNYDSMNKNVVESVIRGEPVNLSRNQALNPYRLNPMGAFKTGGLITEWSNSAKRAGFTRQPITGASSQGPIGPKSSKVTSYTNAGVRALMDLPSNEYVPTQNLIPIQTEKGEMIVLPTGDLMPVMARKRHHQMADDEVTDVAPENSYILSAHGEVRINRDEADLIITENGVKPYRLGMKQDPPTEKTLASIMSKKTMRPAEVAKKINNMFPVLSTRNPFEIAANNENKVNRKPYLEGLIQLSELDKVRKGLAEPSETDQQQMMALQSNQGSPMLAKQGGRAISYIGVPKAQAGLPAKGGLPSDYMPPDFGYLPTQPIFYPPTQNTGPAWGGWTFVPPDQVSVDPGWRAPLLPNYTDYPSTTTRTAPEETANSQSQQSGSLLGTIAAPLNFGARLITSNAIRRAEKEGIARERGIYDQGFSRMGTLMGVGAGMEAAMLGAQDPFVQFRETPDTYFRQMRTQTPPQIAEARANMTFANLPNYSNMGMAGLAATNAAYAQGLNAANQALLATQEADRAAYNQQQLQLQQLLAQNVAGRLAAERATTANINRILSGYGGLANRFTQGQLDLTGQRMGANLGLSRAEQASRTNLYGNRLGAFTTFTGDVVSSGEGGLKALSGLLGLG